MVQSVTERLQKDRLTVVSVNKEMGLLRVKGEAACSDLACPNQPLVVTDGEVKADLGLLNPGDIIRVESGVDQSMKIVVVRRAWEELTSPEM